MGPPGAVWAWIRQVYTPLMSEMIVTGHALPLHLQGAQADLPKSRGEGRQPLAPQQRQLYARLLAAQHPVRNRRFFFWVLALTKSLGPAADRHQTARPAPESRICAFTTLFAETFYAPPLCTANIEFLFTSEPLPGPFLCPFPPELILLHPSCSHNWPTSLFPPLSPAPCCSDSRQEPKELMMLFFAQHRDCHQPQASCTCLLSQACLAPPNDHPLPADTQSLSALLLSTLPYLLIPALANTPICLQPTASTQAKCFTPFSCSLKKLHYLK